MPVDETRSAPADLPAPWRVALDTGGTFTDLVAVAPDGTVRRVKVPSDGSLVATVASVVDGRSVRVRWGTGGTAPRGLVAGWTVRGASGEWIASGNGADVIDAARSLPAPLKAGEVLRLTPPAGIVDAPRIGLHVLTGTPIDAGLPPLELRLSTTRGTNALLEGRGARVGVLVSQGLEGVVTVGDQTRRDLFARVPSPRRRLAHAVRALPERTLADGGARARAAPHDIDEAVRALQDAGCDVIVASLAHALVDDGRERHVAAAAARLGVPARAASDVAAHPRLLARTETAVVAARVAPTLEAFALDARRSAPAGHRAFVFTSAGVLQDADRFEPRDTLFSGPAGGAVAVARIAASHGLARAIGFDMGGTSTDVCRVADGRIALRRETRLAEATVAAPALAIDSVAAGGGSICAVRDGALEVGPASAGASPGPACYGRGGPLAVSDLNLLAGRLDSTLGSMPVDRAAAKAALVRAATERGLAPDDALAGFLDVADTRMALAIESLCVRDGVDPRGAREDGRDGHALVAFGGAGGQHGCAIASRLGLATVVFPMGAGFLCAEGVRSARAARIVEKPVLASIPCRPATEGSATVGRLHERLEDVVSAAGAEAAAALAADGFVCDEPPVATARLRLAGQEASLEVPFEPGPRGVDAMRTAFAARFTELFGYAPPERDVEIESMRVEAFAPPEPPPADPPRGRTDRVASAPSATPVRMLSDGRWCDARRIDRAALVEGARIDGPALVADLGDTVVIDEGWRAEATASGDLVAVRTRPHVARESTAESELFAARLESIALAMGHVLERTALSPNIRDRLDFSCAVLDADGTLVQNAPHLPVHLGALGVATRSVEAALGLSEGDVAVVNHPAFGGSHLPDVTTVAPVHHHGRRVAFVAVRAHHAEIGGTRPGSFPPDARSLAEEGVVLEPFLAVQAGRFDRGGARARFAGGPHPSRDPDENLADLEAQLAASRQGVESVRALVAELGRDRFARCCAAELDRAERALRRAVLARPPASRTARRWLDDGTEVAATVSVENGVLRIGLSSPVAIHPRNFNAPRAVTQAAAMYALRLFVDEPVAMNEGLLRAVDLRIAPSMLAPAFDADPARCPPVVAGNVETSQSVVAVLVDALGLAAESQSTMNNVLFGNARFGVYETLGGGAGAGPSGPGASAVHVHMSNTRLTDVEVLERRAPVVVTAFRERPGSGGAGLRRGGDGLVRGYEFREAVSLSFFGSRRRVAPEGAEGGAPGACGLQRTVVAGRASVSSEAVLSLELAEGDAFTVETPGGGGHGAPGVAG
jgi:5-oxoprolinase (ATP-hydrolysing)